MLYEGPRSHDRHRNREALARCCHCRENQSVEIFKCHENKVLAQCTHDREQGNLSLQLNVVRIHQVRNAFRVLSVGHNRNLNKKKHGLKL